MSAWAEVEQVIRDMDELCRKYDAIGAGHAAMPVRQFANRLRAGAAITRAALYEALQQHVGSQPSHSYYLDEIIAALRQVGVEVGE